MTRRAPSDVRRRRLLMRAVPLAILATGAFAIGVYAASGSPEKDAVVQFGDAWEQGDLDAMYAQVSPAAQDEYDFDAFKAAYDEAAQTATVQGVDAGETRSAPDQDGKQVIALPVDVQTTAFGTVSGEIGMPVSEGKIDWRPDLVFPGLTEGAKLTRQTQSAPRAPILAADRSPIAEGPVDSRTTDGAGGIIAGEVGEPQGERAAQMQAEGFPDDALGGVTGLELAFDKTLAGTPGGKLIAKGPDGKKVLVQTKPIPGKPVRTTLDPDLQEATTTALGDTYGGAAVLDARNGNVLALAGIAFSAPQPPGSTFKIITAAASLEDGITTPDEEFPVVQSAIVGGREVSNAHDELCGGTLVQSFAQSCNSVFAPLGEELGGKRLVDAAEKFGFNSPPTLYNKDSLQLIKPLESSIPEDLTDDMAGISAIGQGEVLATPLEMASVAQAIGNKGVRSPTSIVKDPALAGDYPDVTAVSPDVAADVKNMMIEVVKSGTGIAAAVPGVTVAGKTGTAELGTISEDSPVGAEEPELDVDAWFTAFAPAENPKIAVAVMVVKADGDGGTIAAPIAQQILQAAL
ncbi:MAG: penicillin-binding transpeptidase domain-containing protein [Solirubrobacterales bacterium]